MKYIILSICFSLVFACQPRKQDTTAIEHQLEGYWVVQKSENAEGEVTPLPGIVYVDFFDISDGEGRRHKLQPQPNGKLKPFAAPLKFKIIAENNADYLEFMQNDNTWRETIEELSSEQLILIDAENNRNFYQPFEPFDKPSQNNL
ncbi:MAG: hypothetical protein RQ756_08800 [Flavobacteriaceae bacterium]|nr:hypothetical protein [Flavobacteriaceae bacterium]